MLMGLVGGTKAGSRGLVEGTKAGSVESQAIKSLSNDEDFTELIYSKSFV